MTAYGYFTFLCSFYTTLSHRLHLMMENFGAETSDWCGGPRPLQLVYSSWLPHPSIHPSQDGPIRWVLQFQGGIQPLPFTFFKFYKRPLLGYIPSEVFINLFVS